MVYPRLGGRDVDVDRVKQLVLMVAVTLSRYRRIPVDRDICKRLCQMKQLDTSPQLSIIRRRNDKLVVFVEPSRCYLLMAGTWGTILVLVES